MFVNRVISVIPRHHLTDKRAQDWLVGNFTRHRLAVNYNSLIRIPEKDGKVRLMARRKLLRDHSKR